MPELNLGPAPESNRRKPFLLAVAALIVIAFAVFYFNPRKTAELSVTKTQLYSAHATYASVAGSTKILGQAEQSEDDLYVIATVHLQNKLRLPIFVDTITGTYTTAEGATSESTALNPHDLSRLEETFTALIPMMGKPLSDAAIAPGETVEGTVLFQLPGLTEKDWKARKSATLTIELAHQSPQTTPIPQQ